MDAFVTHLKAWAKMYGSIILASLAAVANYWFGLDDGEPFIFKEALKAGWLIVLAGGGGAGLIANRVGGVNVQAVAKGLAVAEARSSTSLSPWFASVFIVILFASFLSGCAQFGGNPYEGVKVDTGRKGIAVTLAELRGANLLLQEIVAYEVITSDDATKIADQIELREKDLERAAIAVAMTGDPSQADNALGLAASTYGVVMGVLAPYLNKIKVESAQPEPISLPEAANDSIYTEAA